MNKSKLVFLESMHEETGTDLSLRSGVNQDLFYVNSGITVALISKLLHKIKKAQKLEDSLNRI